MYGWFIPLFSLGRQKVKPQNQNPKTKIQTEITNTRVAWFSIFSLLVTVATGGFTVFHLRGFFKKRKLV